MIEVEIAILIGTLLSLLSGLAGFTYARSMERKENREQGIRAAELRQFIVEAVDEALVSQSRAQFSGGRQKELLEPNQLPQERANVDGEYP